VLANRGTMLMPLRLQIDFSDGTSESVALPVQMWNLGPRFTHRVSGPRAIQRVVIDPRRALPDTDRANNSWVR